MELKNVTYKIKNFSIIDYYNYINDDLLLIRYWDKSPNFGDFMNPFIFESITKKKVKSAFKVINFLKKTEIMGIGSIISGDLKNSVIWGSGVISNDIKIKEGPKEVLHIRGKYSKKVLEKHGIKCPEIYGDPAVLLPEIVSPSLIKKFKLGILIHYYDNNNKFVLDFIKKFKSEEIIFINPLDNLFEIIEKITSCDYVLSSSLHGLIVAEAYGIPSLRLKSNELSGGDFKFNDYYSSIGLNKHNVLYLKLNEINLNDHFFI